MTRVWLAATFGAVIAFAMGAAACDSSEAETPAPDVDGGADADASLDANRPNDEEDAGPDAGELVRCTADDFCHTVLPDGQVLRGVWGDDQGVVWAVSEQGNILRWDGTTWKIRHSNAGPLFGIWGSSATDIWAVGTIGLLHGQGASSDDLTWTAVPVPGLDGVPLRAIAGRTATDIWAVGGRSNTDVFPPEIEGRVLHFSGPSSDPGGGWTAETAADMTTLETVWTTAQGDVWIGGTFAENPWVQLYRGVLLHRPPGADTFSEVSLPVLDRGGGPTHVQTMTGGATISGDVIVLGVVDHAGAYLRGNDDPDGGSSLVWEETTFRVQPSYLHAVWGPSSSDVWLAGDFGRLRHWDGTSWSLPRIVVGKVPVTNAFYAVWARAADDLWFVGDRIALHKRPSTK